MSLKKNVLANYLGQGWRALMGLLFIPIYIRYLGVEAYGLIGIFAVLQAWLGLLDMGTKPALVRESARFTGGVGDAQSIRDLLRSIEFFVFAIVGVIGLGIWAASTWLATDWVKAENLPTASVSRAFALMGGVAALRFVESIYVSSLVGLQHQVLENAITSTMATVRGVGAIGVLVLISPTIEAYFVWQCLISLATAGVFVVIVYRILPSSPRSGRFSISAMAGIWRFAAGVTAITFLALLLTQVDKILLSRILTLEAFGYYALAGTVASSLYMLTSPVCTAFYPRFTELVTRSDNDALRAAYHQGAQLVTVLMGATAIVLIIFAERTMVAWTADSLLSTRVSPLLRILALGTLLNGLLWIPYQMQLANGWTTLAIKVNIVAVVVLIPGILITVSRYGTVGAAWMWVALNVGYLIFTIHFMHRRILSQEKWRWYLLDVALPLTAAATTASLCNWVMPDSTDRVWEIGVLMLSFCCTLASAGLAAATIRNQLKKYGLVIMNHFS